MIFPTAEELKFRYDHPRPVKAGKGSGVPQAYYVIDPNSWGDHPEWPMADWRYEVEQEDTRLGYWEWVASMIKSHYENQF